MSVSLSRFHIVEGNPPLLPHKCSVCGSISGTFVDFGLDLEFYGTVYICLQNCFLQLANELGYRSPAQHHVALEAIEKLRAETVELTLENEKLRNALGAVDFLRDRAVPAGDDLGTELESDEGNERTAEKPAKPARSRSKQGSDDVRTALDLNELL